MSVSSIRITQYYIECDNCHVGECCPDSSAENVHSKQQAIKWANMHKMKTGQIFCSLCYHTYKANKIKDI